MRDLAIQSSCSIAVVTHALIVSSGDVALARRYLVNSEKVVDEMLLMTYEQDKWLIQHGKQQQQAALDGAPVALVSDADAIKLQVIAFIHHVHQHVRWFCDSSARTLAAAWSMGDRCGSTTANDAQARRHCGIPGAS